MSSKKKAQKTAYKKPHLKAGAVVVFSRRLSSRVVCRLQKKEGLIQKDCLIDPTWSVFQRQSWKCTTMSFTYWSVQGKNDTAQPMSLSFFNFLSPALTILQGKKKKLQLVHLKEIRPPFQHLDKILRNNRYPEGIYVFYTHFVFTQQINIF